MELLMLFYNTFSKTFEEKTTFRAKNIKILYYLQFLLAKVSQLLANNLYSLYRIVICNILVNL